MRGLWPLLKKELREQLRTYRVLVVLLLFGLIGMSSPILAKLTPVLLEKFASSDQTAGIELIITKQPDIGDAMFQYQKNLAMLPLLVILLAMGSVSGEKRRGTLPLVVTRPISRRAVIRSKVLATGLLLTAAMALSAGLCLGYTVFLFGEVALGTFALLNSLFLLTLLTYLALTVLASTLLDSAPAAAGVGIACFALFSGLGLLDRVGAFTPAGLMNAATDLTLGREPAALWTPIGASTLLLLLAVGLAEQALSRQEL